MSNNTCPYCGSAEDSILSGRFFRKYKCDSTKFIDRYTAETRLHQSEACMRIELATLRNHSRDLQQAYDHVLECEQNRCREVVELQDQLKAVTAERDDLRDTAAAIMTAACGTDDLDEQERLCNAAGTKPSHYIASLRKQLADLQQRLDAAPEICSEGMTENDAYEVVEREWSEHPESTFRLVRDDQPGEPDA